MPAPESKAFPVKLVKEPGLPDFFAKYLAPGTAIGLICQALDLQASSTAAITLAAAGFILFHEKRNKWNLRPWWLVPSMISIIAVCWALRGNFIEALRDAIFVKVGQIHRVELSGNPAILEDIGLMIEGSRQSIEFVGVNFYASLPQYKPLLLKKLQSEVDVTFLVMSPTSKYLEEVARGFGQTRDELKAECEATIANLRTLAAEAARAKGKFTVCTFEMPPRTRLYIFDRKKESGETIFVPHVYGLNSAHCPAYFASHAKQNVAQRYHESWDLIRKDAMEMSLEPCR